ncbi:hypothetical protein MM193_00490 [Limosilactobacillus reuteri]|uniref:hypothetical protein n=1 Tax=Limosilactobacillus reuteri TaxID=1598 RepID=UPI001F4EDB06|nr:hypothetical protein [Limosilactobacillus reuteri]MCH9393176.1 hypothetical protein [Limosilactobacillus reuteri]
MELETQLNASDRNTRAIIGNNFQKIQEEDSKDDATFEKFQKDTNTRLDQLEQEKATHDEVKEMRQELQQRINHLYAGDPRTIKTVVKEILEEKGVI